MTDATSNYAGSRSFNLSQCLILPSTGSRSAIDVTNLLIELTIFENLFAPCLSGHLIIGDGLDLISNLPITGFDYLQLTYSKPGINFEVTKSFRIYKIDGRDVHDVNQTSQVYTLRFASDELLVSEASVVQKSYKGKSPTDIIKDILAVQLKAPTEKIPDKNFEMCPNLQDLIIPSMEAFDAITFVATRSVPPFVFFENRDGYKFKSLNTLLSAPAVSNYKYSPKNLPSASLQDDLNNVIRYEFEDVFDVLRAKMNGMFGSQLSAVDCVKWKSTDTNFSYADYFEKQKHLGPGSFDNGFKNRLGATASASNQAYRRTYPTNVSCTTDAYIKANQPGLRQTQVEQWMLQRQSTFEQLNYLKLNLVVPGTTGVTVGDVINFGFPSLNVKSENSDNLHPYYQGRYLVTAIRHKINLGSYEMIIEASKESLARVLPAAAMTDTTIGRQIFG